MQNEGKARERYSPPPPSSVDGCDEPSINAKQGQSAHTVYDGHLKRQRSRYDHAVIALTLTPVINQSI